MEEFREYVNCRLCRADEYEIKYKWPDNFYNHSEFETASWDGRKEISLQILKCKQCGLAYTNPSFKEEYLNFVYPVDLVPNLDQISTKEDLISLFHFNKYESLFSNLERDLGKESCVVDIGTRYGGLPYYMRKQGYSAFGLELNERSVNLAKKFGLDFVNKGTINDIEKYAGKELPEHLDCVIMDDVLEHLVNPLRDVLEISKHQKKGGKIVMRQMNWDSLGHKLFCKNWYYLQPAAHMSYFTPKTASVLLNKCGYKKVDVFKMSTFENLQKSLKQNLKNKVRGKEDWIVNGNKMMYLQKRSKAYNDMFTIVGEKK